MKNLALSLALAACLSAPGAITGETERLERNLAAMQFIVNHTTFDSNDALDASLLAMLKPLGITQGNTYDPETAPDIDGAALRAVAQRVAAEELPGSVTRTGSTRTSSSCSSQRARFRSRCRPFSPSPGRSGSPPTRRSTLPSLPRTTQT